jgi:hypothetical protein
MPPRLDLAKVLAGAFLVPWWRRAALVRVLAVPVALIFAYTLLWQEYAAPWLGALGGWLSAGLYGLLFTLFAVRCHRVVLLDAELAAPVCLLFLALLVVEIAAVSLSYRELTR